MHINFGTRLVNTDNLIFSQLALKESMPKRGFLEDDVKSSIKAGDAYRFNKSKFFVLDDKSPVGIIGPEDVLAVVREVQDKHKLTNVMNPYPGKWVYKQINKKNGRLIPGIFNTETKVFHRKLPEPV